MTYLAHALPGNGHVPLIVDKPLVCGRGLPGRLSSHCSSIQHGRPTPSHRPALTLARCSAPADFASLRVLGAPAASRPPLLTSSLVALHSLLHWGLRTGLRFAGPVFRGCGALRAVLAPSPLRGFDGNGLFRAQRAAFVRPAVGGPVFRRTALAFGGAVFRRCGRPLGVSSRLQPLCGLRLRTACARASSRFAASNGQRPGRECIFTFRTDPQFSMVVPLRSQARLWLSLLHWAYYGLFPPLAAAFVRPCASLARCSVPAHFVCSPLQPFGPSPFCKHLLCKKCQK